MSGSTRIHIECTKQWIKRNRFDSITVWSSNDGYRTCVANGIDERFLKLMDTSVTERVGFWVDYIWRIIKGVWLSLWYRLNRNEYYYVYAASDFWADFFPALGRFSSALG